MFNEGAPEFFVDQGLYYPIAANQGYYCTGFESSGEWDDHHKFFAVDGVDVQYPGMQTENMPYVYYNYTPSYEYAQSPYNPYNPYIPGAMIGVDGQFESNQQFYTAVPQYQNGVPSSYYPVIVQSRPDIFVNGSLDSIQDGVMPVGGRPSSQGHKHNLSSSSAPFTMIPQKPTSGPYSSSKAAEGKGATAGPSKHPLTNVRGAYGSLQGNVSKGRIQSSHAQFKPSLQYGSGLPGSAADAYGYSVVDKLHSKFHQDRSVTNVNESPAVLIEQNKGPRTGKSKTQLAVKANTTSVRHCDSLENIASHCNKTDFPVDYVNAKFFVIKSYSEDDVHKSIKYNVWSSTPNGNKKLDHAYKDAQIIAAGKPSGCPIFLFFSVNASGQYCGVAEMIGPVDFQKDMDFWQQDKWSGSFPVKWHIIKDVPNTNFRQITLENNENKPVTNSRDTQEILFKPGLEMLRIMKNHTMKTSLLDDFMYYEDRQKMMQDGKARVLVKSYGTALFVPTLEPPRKISHPLEVSASKGDEATDNTNLNQHERSTPYVADQGSPNSEIKEIYKSSSNDTNASTSKDEAADDLTSVIKIGSLTINPKRSGASKLLDVSAVVNPKPVDAVTLVSSIPVKPNKLNTVSTTGMSESPGLFTVGTIPLDPRAMKLQK